MRGGGPPAPGTVPSMLNTDELRAAVDGRTWYHTIELAPGIVTPGWFDTRRVRDQVPLPGDLAGKRCLDVGTFDGFWAFEMEARGAAEVLAVDVADPSGWDWPATSGDEQRRAIGERMGAGEGFEIARRALGSAVERRELSIYDLDATEVGRFDVVYVGSLLLHLRDPVRGLEQVRSVCRGQLVLVDNIDPFLTVVHPRRPVATFDGVGRPWWWTANRAALLRMLRSAGFAIAGSPATVWMPPGPGHPPATRPLERLRSRTGREHLLRAWRGDPHLAVSARPRRIGPSQTGAGGPSS